jgi:hypothetical protein
MIDAVATGLTPQLFGRVAGDRNHSAPSRGHAVRQLHAGLAMPRPVEDQLGTARPDERPRRPAEMACSHDMTCFVNCGAASVTCDRALIVFKHRTHA